MKKSGPRGPKSEERIEEGSGNVFADLLNIADSVHPVRRFFVQDVGHRVPLDIINLVLLAVAVAPTLALFHQLGIDRFTQSF